MLKKDSAPSPAPLTEASEAALECCAPKSACLGRPRAFDPEVALERAMQVFWRKGYEGASLSDLTEAMGINRPSLYAAFGNKESLFRKVVERYSALAGASVAEALSEPTARGAIERLLRERVAKLAQGDAPAKCLLMQGALSCELMSPELHHEIMEHACNAQRTLQERIERGKAEGELPSDADSGALARYFAMMLQGLSVQAASGADQAELAALATLAMRAWPENQRVNSRPES